MKQLQKLMYVSQIVKNILTENTQTRNNDGLLYLKVLEYYANVMNVDLKQVSIVDFLESLPESQFPAFETVRRSRQKVQAECPELSGSAACVKARAEAEKDFREFARL